MQIEVINKGTTLLDHILHVAKAQRKSCVPTGRHQHYFQRIVQTLEYLAQFGAITVTVKPPSNS